MPGPIGEAFITVSPDLSQFDSKVLTALEASLKGLQSHADALSKALDKVDPTGLNRLSAAGTAAVRDLEQVETAAVATDAALDSIEGLVEVDVTAAVRDMARVEAAAAVTDQALDSIDVDFDLDPASALAALSRITTQASAADAALDAVDTTVDVDVVPALAGLNRVQAAAAVTDAALGSIDADIDIDPGAALSTLSRISSEARSADAALSSLDSAAAGAGNAIDAAGRQGGRARGSFRDAGREVLNLNNTFSKLTTSLKGIGFEVISEQASALVSNVGRGISSLLKLGVTSAASAEQSKIAFEGLLGSAQQGTAFFEELQDFAARTPFEFAGLAKSAQTFLALGQSTKDVITNLEAVGAAASAAGASAESIDRVTTALAQIQGAGKLTADNLNQITDALPNVSRTAVFTVLAERLGITTAAVSKLAETGGILAEDAIPSIIEAFRRVPGAAGALEKQAESLTGIFSTLKDTVKIELTDAFEGLIPVLKRNATAVLPPLQRQLAGLGEVLADVAEDLLPLFIEGIDTFGPAIIEAVRTIGDVLVQVGPEIVNFGDVLADAFRELSPLAGTLGGIFTSNLSTFLSLLSTATPILKVFAEVLALIPTPLLSILLTMKSFNRSQDIFSRLFQGITIDTQNLNTEVKKTPGFLAGFSSAAKKANPNVSRLSSGISGMAQNLTGLASAGPALAVAGISIAVGFLASKWQEAEARRAEHQAGIEALAGELKQVITGEVSFDVVIPESVEKSITDLSDAQTELLNNLGITASAIESKLKNGGSVFDLISEKARTLGVDIKEVGDEATVEGINDYNDSLRELAGVLGVDFEELARFVEAMADVDDTTQEGAKTALLQAKALGILNTAQVAAVDAAVARGDAEEDWIAILEQSGSAEQLRAKAYLTNAENLELLTTEQRKQVKALDDTNAPLQEYLDLFKSIAEENAEVAASTSVVVRSFGALAAEAALVEGVTQDVVDAIKNLSIETEGFQLPDLTPNVALPQLEGLVDAAAMNPEGFKAAAAQIAEATGLTEDAVIQLVDTASTQFSEFAAAAQSSLPKVGEEMTKLSEQVSATDYTKRLNDQAKALENFSRNVGTLLASSNPDAVRAGLEAIKLGPNVGAGIAQELVDNINGSLPTKFVEGRARVDTAMYVLEGQIKGAGQIAVSAGGVLGTDVVNAVNNTLRDKSPAAMRAAARLARDVALNTIPTETDKNTAGLGYRRFAEYTDAQLKPTPPRLARLAGYARELLGKISPTEADKVQGGLGFKKFSEYSEEQLKPTPDRLVRLGGYGRAVAFKFVTGVEGEEAKTKAKAGASGLVAAATGGIQEQITKEGQKITRGSGSFVSSFVGALSSAKSLAQTKGSGTKLGGSLQAGITAARPAAVRSAGTFSRLVSNEVVTTVTTAVPRVSRSGQSLAASVGSGIAADRSAGTAAKAFSKQITTSLATGLDLGQSSAAAAGRRLALSVARGARDPAALASVRISAANLAAGFYLTLANPSFLSRLYKVGSSWVKAVVRGVRDTADMQSPSKVMMEAGLDTGEGYLQGLTDPAMVSGLALAGSDLVTAVTSNLDTDLYGAGKALYGSLLDGFKEAAGSAPIAESALTGPLADGIVKLGEVSMAEWERLLEQGWKGRAGDNMEALYAPAVDGLGDGFTRLVDALADGFVRFGEVSQAEWDRLLAAGWQGKAGDGIEALYAPAVDALRDGMVRLGEVSQAEWDRLLAMGWKGDPTDRMEALYAPPPVSAATFFRPAEGGLTIEHLELHATDVRGVFRETNTELRALARRGRG